MANTVSILGYANTFGDWVVTTNYLAGENNNLAAKNYTKSTGTLIVSDPSNAFQANGPVNFYNTVSVTNPGSSVSIDNNLTVKYGQVYFSNTQIGLNNAGQMIVGGLLSVNGPGLGLAVLNNSQLNGYLRVTGNTVIANTLSVSGTTVISNTVSISLDTTVGGNVIAQNYVNVTKDVNAVNFNATNSFNGYNLAINGNGLITNNLNVYQQTNLSGNVFAGNNITTALTVTSNVINANTTINTPSLNVSVSGYISNLTSLLLNANTVYANTFNANTTINTPSLNVSTTGYVTNLTSSLLNVSGSLFANTFNANNTINTKILNVSGNTFTGNLNANGYTFLGGVLNAAGSAYVNSLSSNGAINGTNLTLSGTTLNATGVYGQFQSLYTSGSVTVNGNFVITGTTVYATNTFTLSANASSPISSYFNVYRPSAANASFRWNEPQQYFELNDVNNGNYYRILTDEYVSDTTYNYGSKNIATSNAVSYLQGVANTANTNINNVNLTLASNSATLQSNIDNANANARNSSYQTTGTLPAARLPASGVTAGYWGGATQIPVLNIDSTGRVISAANTAVSSTLATAGSSGTGSVSLISQSLTVTSSNTYITTVVNSGQTLTVTPQTSGATFGTYGSSTSIPVLTVDTFGRVTNITTTAISTSITLAGGSGSGSVAGGGTLTINGSTGLTTSVSGSTYTLTNSGVTSITGTTNQITASSSTGGVTLSLPQNINSGAAPTFAGTNFTSIPNGALTNSTISGISLGGSLNSLTFSNGGSGDASASTYNGSAAKTISYNSIGASPLAGSSSLTTTGTITSGIWSASFGAVSGANLTGLTAGNLTGTIPSGVLGNSTLYVGTTAIALNRASTSQTLTGVSIDGNAGGSAATFTSTSQNSQFNSIGVGTPASTTAGEIRATNNITAYYSSDKKFKENVVDIPNALDAVDAIGGKLFDWTDAYLEAHGGEDGYFNQKQDFGVIAQDVQSVFPRAVRTRPDGSLAVDYEKLVALSFAAIKELKAEIEELKKS